MLKIYGNQLSRASRVLWALEELGLEYEYIPVDHNKGESRREDFLTLNPMGKIPVLVDDGFVLTESIAITVYLANSNASPLWPASPQAQARILQWSSWGITELEFHLTNWVRERRTAAPRSDYMASCLEQAAAILPVLDTYLQANRFIAGDSFTVGDVNVGNILSIASQLVDVGKFSAIQAWLDVCRSRPAFQRAAALA